MEHYTRRAYCITCTEMSPCLPCLCKYVRYPADIGTYKAEVGNAIVVALRIKIKSSRRYQPSSAHLDVVILMHS